jgi:hypothetical protein
MRFVNMILIFGVFSSIGCNSRKVSRPIQAEEKKETLLIWESSAMNAKRLYEVAIECRKLKLSPEDAKKRFDAIESSSRKALEICRKSGYTLPYKPDWGGREEYLRKVLLSDLMPDSSEKEKKEKNVQKHLDECIGRNVSDFRNGKISEAEKLKFDSTCIDNAKKEFSP